VKAGLAEIACASAVSDAFAVAHADGITSVRCDRIQRMRIPTVTSHQPSLAQFVDLGRVDANVLFEPPHAVAGDIVFDCGVVLLLVG